MVRSFLDDRVVSSQRYPPFPMTSGGGSLVSGSGLPGGSTAKTVVVAIAGGVVTLAGIALLVLPGPGFILVAAGLAILATQFAWARKPLDYAKEKGKEGVDEIAHSWSKAILSLLGAAWLIGVGVVEIWFWDLPLMNVWTDAVLIASGVFLVGTVIYARTRRSHQGRLATTRISETLHHLRLVADYLGERVSTTARRACSLRASG